MLMDGPQTLEERFKQKQTKQQQIDMKVAKSICKDMINDVSDTDFNSVFEGYLSEDSDYYGLRAFNLEVFKEFFERIKMDCMRVSCLSALCISDFNQFVYVKESKIVSSIDHAKDLQNYQIINLQFNDLEPNYFYHFLQKNEGNGLLHLQQFPESELYTFNHKLQSQQLMPIQQMDDAPQLYFLHLLFNFNYQEALNVLKTQLKDHEENQQLLPILESLAEMSNLIHEHQHLKVAFIGRKQPKIKLIGENLKQLQLKNTLDFSCMVMESMIDLFHNPIMKIAAMFLSHKLDKQHVYEFISTSNNLPIFSRFLFGKRFLPVPHFQNLKNQLIQQAIDKCQIGGILLFGKGQQSEIILQKYLDKTNDLRKVAIVSVFLTGFQESKLLRMFITQYQWFLDKLDEELGVVEGVSRQRIFHKKCCERYFWKKKIFYQETLSLRCQKCGQSQLFRQMKGRMVEEFNKNMNSTLNSNVNVRHHGISVQNPTLNEYYFTGDPLIQSDICLICAYNLPKCMVCLRRITCYNPYGEIDKSYDGDKFVENSTQGISEIRDAFVCCPNCFHGGHYGHIKQWQQLHPKTCVVADCRCECQF